jgi:hypothetical protein
MFLAGNHGSKVIRTCTENPRVGSSILSLGTILSKKISNLQVSGNTYFWHMLKIGTN